MTSLDGINGRSIQTFNEGVTTTRSNRMKFRLLTVKELEKYVSKAWRTLLVYTAKNLTSFGSYELIKTQIASIFGKKLKFINSFSLNIFFLAVRPK